MNQQQSIAIGKLFLQFLADFIISYFKKELENKFKYFPKVCLMYVDDIFTSFNTKKKMQIKSTWKKEVDEKLLFLNILVIKSNLD